MPPLPCSGFLSVIAPLSIGRFEGGGFARGLDVQTRHPRICPSKDEGSGQRAKGGCVCAHTRIHVCRFVLCDIIVYICVSASLFVLGLGLFFPFSRVRMSSGTEIIDEVFRLGEKNRPSHYTSTKGLLLCMLPPGEYMCVFCFCGAVCRSSTPCTC